MKSWEEALSRQCMVLRLDHSLLLLLFFGGLVNVFALVEKNKILRRMLLLVSNSFYFLFPIYSVTRHSMKLMELKLPGTKLGLMVSCSHLRI